MTLLVYLWWKPVTVDEIVWATYSTEERWRSVAGECGRFFYYYASCTTIHLHLVSPSVCPFVCHMFASNSRTESL